MNPLPLEDLPARLVTLAQRYDAAPAWPQESIDLVAAAGCWKWVIPQRYGGEPLVYAELLRSYETIARGCLTTALLLTQRDAGCDLIARGENDALKERLLPEHAAGRRFTSIGIAQLTTSLDRRGPKLRATRAGDGFRLDGVIPWVSGACRCDEIVTGAVLPDGMQILACVPCDAAGLTLEPPLKLLALEASCTSRVRCDAVRIGPEHMVRGPRETVLSRRSPVKGLTVSAVGLGAAGALVDRLRERADAVRGGELRAAVETIAGYTAAYERLRDDFYAAADRLAEDAETPGVELRVRVNDLLVRLAAALLCLSKGAGFVRPSAAERLLREAMFFEVWSAPPDVQAGTLERLVPRG